jgi:hypothetical protein
MDERVDDLSLAHSTQNPMLKPGNKRIKPQLNRVQIIGFLTSTAQAKKSFQFDYRHSSLTRPLNIKDVVTKLNGC